MASRAERHPLARGDQDRRPYRLAGTAATIVYMSDTIIVGFDGTTQSETAVEWAAVEAGARKCDLRVVSSYEIPVTGDMLFAAASSDAYVRLLDEAHARVRRTPDELATRHPSVQVSTDVNAGPVTFELLSGAGVGDLIVVGASSHEGATAFWLGSTPRYLVRHSPCPVVVVRDFASAKPPERIVVGVDDSEDARHALIWAVDEADLWGVELHVVHAWSYAYTVHDRASAEARDTTRVEAARVLDRAVEMARERAGSDVTSELIATTPVPALLDLVRDGDVLVLGSRGRGAIKSALFGSTVNSVLDHTAVPTVVVPHAEANG
jgi:nucleotide-binding universal stress UspA family protein